MNEATGWVAWLAIAPVKSMALVFLDHAALGLDGIAGDRAFAIVDEHDRLVNGKRDGILATVAVEHDAATGELRMRFPGGTVAESRVALGLPIQPIFFGEPRPAHLVDGPWDAALERWSGQRLRLVAMSRGEGPDRGPTATLLSTASLAELATADRGTGVSPPAERARWPAPDRAWRPSSAGRRSGSRRRASGGP